MTERNQVTVKWLGHSSFLISLGDGPKIVTDPFDSTVGYPMPDETADICMVSHDHFDHNCVSVIKGDPQVVKGAGEKEAKGIKFKGVASYHDEKEGKERGENTIWTFQLGGIKFAHVGDLGIDLDASQRQQIGAVDILFVPIGGFYTVDAAAAAKVVDGLNPKVVIPMHYKTAFLGDNFPLSGVDEFLKGKENVVKVGQNTANFSKDDLPDKTTIYVLEYKK